MNTWLFLALALPLVAAILVVIAARSPRVLRADLMTGLVRVALAALVLTAVVAGFVAVNSVGKPFMFGGSLNAGGAIMLGLIGGVVVGLAYLIVAAGAVALGLLAGMGRSWAGWGWLVGPLIVALPVFGLLNCGFLY